LGSQPKPKIILDQDQGNYPKPAENPCICCCVRY